MTLVWWECRRHWRREIGADPDEPRPRCPECGAPMTVSNYQKGDL